jgi:hypothetical protein
MGINVLKRKIRYRRFLLNKLTLFLKPTNILIIGLSQNLDKLIYEYQYQIYKKYMMKNKMLKLGLQQIA